MFGGIRPAHSEHLFVFRRTNVRRLGFAVFVLRRLWRVMKELSFPLRLTDIGRW
jgi:hypothetical protein